MLNIPCNSLSQSVLFSISWNLCLFVKLMSLNFIFFVYAYLQNVPYIHSSVNWTAICYITITDIAIYCDWTICPYMVSDCCSIVRETDRSRNEWSAKELFHHIHEILCSFTMLFFQHANIKVTSYYCLFSMKQLFIY